MTTKDNPALVQADSIARMAGAVDNLNDTMKQVTTGMKTSDAIRLLGTVAARFNFPAGATGGTPGLLSSSPGMVCGYSFHETAGQPVTVRVLDGIDGFGAFLFAVTLPAGGSATLWTLPGGMAFTSGLIVQLSGAGANVEGAVFTQGGYRPGVR